MTSKRINILVYSGTGASPSALHHTQSTLRSLLQPNYAVLPISTSTLLSEPWASTCALLVFPGGGDLGYCRSLNGAGNRRIKSYVANGGAYLGFCAGGYYGSRKCEFEVGRIAMEVVGERELGFFPGICRGGAYAGFEYGSEKGTKAVKLEVAKGAFGDVALTPTGTFTSYCNGGGVFVDADKFTDRGVTVLARYTEALDVDGGSGAAAIVHCRVEGGAAILTGPHPEFSSSHLSAAAKDLDPSVVPALADDDDSRTAFLRACLSKLGLQPNPEEAQIPSLSAIHLSSADHSAISTIVKKWEDISTIVEGDQYIIGEADTFHIQHESHSKWSVTKMTRAALDAMKNVYIAGTDDAEEAESTNKRPQFTKDVQDPGGPDYSEAIKTVFVHDQEPVAKSTTPHFNHAAYYAAHEAYRFHSPASSATSTAFGHTLLYGETVTSTSTLLEKNPTLNTTLPPGTTLTATHQLLGRGRGSNIWLSPPGSLMFSTLFTHPLALNTTAPLIFIQYIAALAVAEGVRTHAHTNNQHDIRYSKLGIRLKWPNDIYALHPSKLAHPSQNPGSKAEAEAEMKDYVKIGGILVNTSYSGGDYTVILGIGLNVSNASPTTSLNALVDAYNVSPHTAKAGKEEPLPHFSTERLLARILTCFTELYDRFRGNGWGGDHGSIDRGSSGSLEELYLRYWLHSNQVVTLEEEGGVKARITGLTRDWGLLIAEEVREDGRDIAGAKRFALQSDSNSFDFLRGLVRRKL